MSGWLNIGQLARECGVSRSTILYYEKLGLMAPAARSDAGYRRYTGADLERLRQVCAYRATGLDLDAIGRLLSNGDRNALISQRLDQINRDMALLREQQAVLVRLLNGEAGVGPMNKEGWTALLRASGLDDAAMVRWHALFEQQNPVAHQAFLVSLGLSDAEVARIRAA
jgi:DNA-binding transcriptional MerR regulator